MTKGQIKYASTGRKITLHPMIAVSGLEAITLRDHGFQVS